MLSSPRSWLPPPTCEHSVASACVALQGAAAWHTQAVVFTLHHLSAAGQAGSHLAYAAPGVLTVSLFTVSPSPDPSLAAT